MRNITSLPDRLASKWTGVGLTTVGRQTDTYPAALSLPFLSAAGKKNGMEKLMDQYKDRGVTN